MPGHTKDSLCFLFTECNVLLGTETLGVYRRSLQVPMLVGYGLTISSMQRAASLSPSAYMLPHGAGIIYGTESCRAFFSDCEATASETKEKILSVFRKGNWLPETVGEAISMLLNDVDNYGAEMVKARELNTGIMVRQLYREFKE